LIFNIHRGIDTEACKYVYFDNTSKERFYVIHALDSSRDRRYNIMTTNYNIIFTCSHRVTREYFQLTVIVLIVITQYRQGPIQTNKID